MSPEEEALLRARLTGGSIGEYGLAPAADRLAGFRDKLMGAAPSIAAGLGSMPGPLGALGTAMQAAPVAAGAIPSTMKERAAEIASGHSAGDPLSLSHKTQAALGAPPEPLEQMHTPPAYVPAAPALNPAYGQVGRTMAGGIGGGAPGGGLKAAFEAAQRDQIAGMYAQRDLTGHLGDAQADRVERVASLEEQQAAKMQADAERQAQIDADAQARLEAFSKKTEQLADEIGKARIDSGRYVRNLDASARITMGIGAIAGGMLQGLNGGTNTFLDHVDRIIDRDIADQQSEIDGKKTQLSSRQTMYGQLVNATGDQRLAAMQHRALVYEGMKADLKAKAERYGIPEAKVQTALATNALDQRIQGVNTGIAEAAWKWAQQQAAQAAAARAHAEQQAWARSMQIAELGLKKDKLEIERIEAGAKAGEDLNKETQSLGKELGAKDLTEGRAAVENAKRRLAGLKPDEGLPGVGKAADIRSRLKPEGWNTLNPVTQGLNAVAGLSDQERVSRGDWEKIKLAYQHQITGSGASNEERAMLSAAFEGARSPAEQRNAIAQADDFFSRREAALKAGYSPRAVQVYEARKEGIQPSLPSTVRVKK